MNTTYVPLNEAFHEITDCFTGADGGVAFIKLQGLIELMDNRSLAGDESADKILAVVIQFGNLIKVAKSH